MANVSVIAGNADCPHDSGGVEFLRVFDPMPSRHSLRVETTDMLYVLTYAGNYTNGVSKSGLAQEENHGQFLKRRQCTSPSMIYARLPTCFM